MKKTNNKGFTLVELIVVLVILAILAAILVPALLGYIDKARQKQVTTNAEAALVATQALASQAYGTNTTAPTASQLPAKIASLTDLDANTFTVTVSYGGSGNHNGYVVTAFTYTDTEKTPNQTATWYPSGDDSKGIPKGGWEVTQ